MGASDTSRNKRRGEGRRLGNAVAPDRPVDKVGRVGEARGFRLQPRRVEKPGRPLKGRRHGVHRRFVGFQVQRHHGGDRRLGQRLAVQRVADQRHGLAGVGATLAPHADGQHLRMIDQCARPRRQALGRGRDDPLGTPGPWHRRIRQPRRSAVQAYGLAGEQIGHHPFDVAARRQVPAPRRGVEGHAEAQIPRRRDGGRAPQHRGQPARQVVGAMVAAEQRHHRAAVFRHGDDGRLASLVGEHRRQGADQGAGGAHAHDRPSVLEQAAQMRAGVVERAVGARHATGPSVHRRAAERRGEASGDIEAAGRQHDDNRIVRKDIIWSDVRSDHGRASRRLWTRTIAK